MMAGSARSGKAGLSACFRRTTPQGRRGAERFPPSAARYPAAMRFPAFKLQGSDGKVHQLKDYRGQPLIVYFYPKDNTPGCTTQACAFRDAYAGLKRAGAAVLGVSPDSLASHERFIAKHSLTFPLLVDEDHRLASELDVWAEKSLYGRKFMGIVRS